MEQRAKRSVYLDALRGFALARVVLYHSTNVWTVTTFTAMPLMFFIAGSLYAASLERRPVGQVVRDRYRRILIPYWAYAAAMVVLWAFLGVLGEVHPLSWISFVMPVLSLDGPQGPGAGTTLELTWIALWYLQMHLILSLVGGWLRRMQVRHGRRYWVSLVVLMVVTLPVGIGTAFFYAICWSVGYLQHDGVLEPWLRPRWVRIAVATGPIGALAFLGFHNSQIVVAGFGAMLLGVFWLVAALGMRDRIEPALDGRRTRALVNWVSARSLTIYLWHEAILYAVIELDLPGAGSPLARMGWVLAGLPVAVVALGWLEDVAARRRPQVWPRLPAANGREAGHTVPNMRSPASPSPGTM